MKVRVNYMRTITIEKTLYKFEELSDKAKTRALDKFRERNDFDWEAECVLEDAKEVAKILGIDIKKIYYSGFCSQGDGACFTGSYNHVKHVEKLIKEYAPLDTKLHDIALLLELSAPLRATIEHHSRYYHAETMQITCYGMNDEEVTSEVDSLESALEGFANWIYQKLEEQYEWVNSDEAIKEMIDANDYEFSIEGKLE